MKQLVIILLFAGLAFGAYKIFTTQPSPPTIPDSQADLILFWGEGCPHCEVVKKDIKDKNLESKIKISYKEVYYNKTNQIQLEATVKKCPEIDSSKGIGVPLGFTKDQKCLYGDQPIIDWLSTK